MIGQIRGKVDWKVGGKRRKWKRKRMQRRRKKKSYAEAHGLEKPQVLRGFIRCDRAYLAWWFTATCYWLPPRYV